MIPSIIKPNIILRIIFLLAYINSINDAHHKTPAI